MKFGAFLDLILKGQRNDDSKYYLATQTIEVDAESGRPHLHSAPTSQFLESLSVPLPSTPALLSDLIPVNYNIWIGGGGREATNSGLHHDYHDNFYVLCAGEKEILTFPPVEEWCCQVEGVKKVWRNGKIVYKSQEEEDAWLGSIDELGVREGVRRLAELETKKKELEKIMEEKGDDEEKVEEELDKVLDEILMLESGGGEGSEDGEDEDGEEEDEGEGEENASKRRAVRRKDPSNFATMPPPKRGTFMIKLFPGDSLYLPAGWFHSVTSTSSISSPEAPHIAFNYWFHPPSSKGRFGRSEGENSFWRDDWKARKEEENNIRG